MEGRLSFGPPHGAPHVPDGLCWLRAEPQWQAMLDARLGVGRATRRRVTFRYTTDYSIDASLEAKVLGWGLSCGGSMQTMRHVDTDYLVEFYPTT